MKVKYNFLLPNKATGSSGTW